MPILGIDTSVVDTKSNSTAYVCQTSVTIPPTQKASAKYLHGPADDGQLSVVQLRSHFNGLKCVQQRKEPIEGGD